MAWHKPTGETPVPPPSSGQTLPATGKYAPGPGPETALPRPAKAPWIGRTVKASPRLAALFGLGLSLAINVAARDKWIHARTEHFEMFSCAG